MQRARKAHGFGFIRMMGLACCTINDAHNEAMIDVFLSAMRLLMGYSQLNRPWQPYNDMLMTCSNTAI